MATVKLWTDVDVAAAPRVNAVFDDIRATRKSDFVNNFWRALANQPALLERTWAGVKEVMAQPGLLDPLTRELVYVAVSIANSCPYCVHSHTAAPRAKGLSEAQYAEFLAVVATAMQTTPSRRRWKRRSTRRSASSLTRKARRGCHRTLCRGK
jgi:AhpD family alkylhydroperoxidase